MEVSLRLIAALLTLLAIALAVTVWIIIQRRWVRLRRRRLDLRDATPVVLVHGFLGFDHLRVLGRRHHYFRGVSAYLEEMGVRVFTARLDPMGTVPERAAQLALFVQSLPYRRVNLIAHSMGGLDARYAISRLHLRSRISAIVTIGTPHRGTPLAELGQRFPGPVLRRVAGLRTDTLAGLTAAAMERFNREVPDVAGIGYFCVMGRLSRRALAVNPVLATGRALLRARAGSSDGLVPVASQAWGVALGEIEASHFAQIGWSPQFDAPSYYAQIIAMLHERGY